MRDEYDFSKARRGAVIASPGKTRITIMLDDDGIIGIDKVRKKTRLYSIILEIIFQPFPGLAGSFLFRLLL